MTNPTGNKKLKGFNYTEGVKRQPPAIKKQTKSSLGKISHITNSPSLWKKFFHLFKHEKIPSDPKTSQDFPPLKENMGKNQEKISQIMAEIKQKHLMPDVETPAVFRRDTSIHQFRIQSDLEQQLNQGEGVTQSAESQEVEKDHSAFRLDYEKTVESIEKEIRHANKSLKKEKNKEQKELKRHFITLLEQRLVQNAFLAKRSNPNYIMPGKAQKAFLTASKITETKEGQPLTEAQILEHGKEFAFLTDSNHFIHKHIQTLEERWDDGTENSFKVLLDGEGNLQLRTYPDAAVAKPHSVTDLIEKFDKNYKLRFDLNYFSIDEKTVGQSDTVLKPTFRTKGDGQHYIAIVTDCPSEKHTLQGSHTWIRMIDAEGNVISVGKFPEEMTLNRIYANVPRVFSSSDRHEWLMRKKSAVTEFRIPISSNDFETKKQKIEEDIQESTTKDFNFFKDNCSDWSVSQVKDFVEINTDAYRIDQFDILFSSFWSLHDSTIPKQFHKLTRPIAHISSTAFLHIPRLTMIGLLGGNKKNSLNPNSKSFIDKLKLTDHKLTHVSHPLSLRNYLKKKQFVLRNKNFT